MLYFALASSVTAWVGRIKALGDRAGADISLKIIFEDISRDDTRPHGAVGEPYRTGHRGSVAPTDYARDETVGEILVLDRERIVISRELDSGQSVDLHVPREGFDLVPC